MNGAVKRSRDAVSEKAQAILPSGDRSDRPLFFVLTILVFLACLFALAGHASYRAAGGWNADLNASATVQLAARATDAQHREAAQIALSVTGIEQAERISSQQARELLNPWLGDISLPEDVPLPKLIGLTLSGETTLSRLQSAFDDADIQAVIDNHGRWSADVRRAAKAVQIVATLALILLIAATSAAAGLATQSGMAARKNIINVLQQVGANPDYIARLFVWRFGKLGARAGLAGAGLSLIVALLFWLISGVGRSALLPSFRLDLGDLHILISAPVLTALICALAARFTAKISIDRPIKQQDL